MNELDEAAEELAESLYKAEEYDNISDDKKAVRTAMNTHQHTGGAGGPVDDVEEYQLTMYQCYPEMFHQYWRVQWNLLKFTRKILSDTIKMKRDFKIECGISQREIAEQKKAC